MRLEVKDVDFEMLEAIAAIRYGLMQCAKWLYRVYIAEDVCRRVNGEVRTLFDEAKKLFKVVDSKWPQ
jgi:hypothetical protein